MTKICVYSSTETSIQTILMSYCAFCTILLYLSNKYTIYVNNYLFLIAQPHVLMFIYNLQGVSYYVFYSTKLIEWKHLYKWLLQKINRLRPLKTS